MNPILMAEAARALAATFPIEAPAALSMIRTYGGVDQARAVLAAWHKGDVAVEPAAKDGEPPDARLAF